MTIRSQHAIEAAQAPGPHLSRAHGEFTNRSDAEKVRDALEADVHRKVMEAL